MTAEAAHQTRLERILGVPLAEDAVRQWPQSGELIDGRVYRNVSIAELRDGKAVRVTDYWGEPFAPRTGGGGWPSTSRCHETGCGRPPTSWRPTEDQVTHARALAGRQPSWRRMNTRASTASPCRASCSRNARIPGVHSSGRRSLKPCLR
jgi:hypothetical protein